LRPLRSSAPESKVNAPTTEPGSISGAGAPGFANAIPAAPKAINSNAANFLIFNYTSFSFRYGARESNSGTNWSEYVYVIDSTLVNRI
jgi:hypothetical protein